MHLSISAPPLGSSNPYLPQGHITHLPTEILFFQIFSGLDFDTLKYAGSVCSQWHGTVETFLNDFWGFMILKKYGQLTVEMLAKSGFKEWRQAFQYAPLAASMHSQSSHRQIDKGDYQIAIDGNKNVRVHNTTTQANFFLKGAEGQDFIRLTYDQDFIFALRSDGKVIQWNFITDTIIHIFDLFDSAGIKYDDIYVVNEKLVVSHKIDDEVLDFHIICYKKAIIEHSFQYKRTGYYPPIPRIMGIEEKKVFIKDGLLINTFDMTSHDINPFFLAADGIAASLIKNFFIIRCFNDRSINLYHASNLTPIGTITIPVEYSVQLQLFLHNDFLIGLFKKPAQVAIWNIESKELVQIFDFQTDPLPDLITFLENPNDFRKEKS